MFEFDINSKHNYRASFANDVCSLIYKEMGGIITEENSEAMLTAVKTYYQHFECCVPNIYELLENQIPLFAWYRLKTYGAENWYFTEEEYSDALKRTLDACVEYYGK